MISEEISYCNNCGVLIHTYFAKIKTEESSYGYNWLCPVCKNTNSYSYGDTLN